MPAEASTQLQLALEVIERHLGSALLAVHLYGSAMDGGLKPQSDIDLLVTVAGGLDETVRKALSLDLLHVSAPPGQSEKLRSLEVTVVVHDEIAPWCYPPRRELQFGEWLREEIAAGIIAPEAIDIDLAILLTKARRRSIALVGPPAEAFFDPVPESDFIAALADSLKLWNAPPDWEGDAPNVALTLARIWYSAATGGIAPKDVAAEWAIPRLPVDLQSVLLEARQVYLGKGVDRLASRTDHMAAFVHYVKCEAAKLLKKRAGN